jgi:predicted RNase H-like nuclease (RuvC/YqgF family)
MEPAEETGGNDQKRIEQIDGEIRELEAENRDLEKRSDRMDSMGRMEEAQRQMYRDIRRNDERIEALKQEKAVIQKRLAKPAEPDTTT